MQIGVDRTRGFVKTLWSTALNDVERRCEMRTAIWIRAFAVVCLVVIGASVASAECPEGKSEMLLITPSGKEKVLCVSDNVVLGIENAAENSAIIVAEPVWPCWSPQLLDEKPEMPQAMMGRFGYGCACGCGRTLRGKHTH
jgi:hypothetical protein